MLHGVAVVGVERWSTVVGRMKLGTELQVEHDCGHMVVVELGEFEDMDVEFEAAHSRQQTVEEVRSRLDCKLAERS